MKDETKASAQRLKLNPCYPYLTGEQTALYFNTSRITIFNWRRNNELPSVVAENGRRYFFLDAIQDWAFTQIKSGGHLGKLLFKTWLGTVTDEKWAEIGKRGFAFIVPPKINALQILSKHFGIDRVKALEIVALGLYCSRAHPEFVGTDAVKAIMNDLVPKELMPLLIKGIEHRGDAEVMKTYSQKLLWAKLARNKEFAARWKKMLATRKKGK